MRSTVYTLAAVFLAASPVACGSKGPTAPSRDAGPSAVVAAGGEKAPPPPGPGKLKSDGVFIKDVTVSYGDGTFDLPCKLDEVEKAFGKASRQEEDSGAHFWDELGVRTISGILKAGETEKWVTNVGFFYTTTPTYRSSGEYKTKSNLKSAYALPLVFNGRAISKDADPKKLKAALGAMLTDPDSSGQSQYIMNKGVLDIHFDDKDAIIYVELRNNSKK